jgi:hypothetical protein
MLPLLLPVKVPYLTLNFKLLLMLDKVYVLVLG